MLRLTVCSLSLSLSLSNDNGPFAFFLFFPFLPCFIFSLANYFLALLLPSTSSSASAPPSVHGQTGDAAKSSKSPQQDLHRFASGSRPEWSGPSPLASARRRLATLQARPSVPEPLIHRFPLPMRAPGPGQDVLTRAQEEWREEKAKRPWKPWKPQSKLWRHRGNDQHAVFCPCRMPAVAHGHRTLGFRSSSPACPRFFVARPSPHMLASHMTEGACQE